MTADMDPAAVEAAARVIHPRFDEYADHGQARWLDEAREAITAYLDRSGLAEARASLERKEAAINRIERDLRTARDGRDEAVARAERAEADLTVCREALGEAIGWSYGDGECTPERRDELEALSRLDHSSEEER